MNLRQTSVRRRDRRSSITGESIRDRFTIEKLESRRLLAADLVVSTDTDVVDNDFSSGEFSLREAILVANSRVGEDTVTFSPELAGSTITLTQGELELRSSLAIEGLGADELTISGGGASRVFAELGNGQRTITMSDLTIADGKATAGSGGGGAFFSNGGDITFQRVVMTNNDTTGGNGSAIVMAFGTLEIIDSAVVNNRGTGVGTLRLQDNTTTITNTTISGNATRGISLFNPSANPDRLSLANVTIADNSNEGIEVVAFASTTMLEYQNTLLANNGGQGSIDARGNENGLPGLAIVSLGHNLLDDTPAGDAAHDAAVGDLRDTDAMLAPLADNGGPTPTHALLEGSPAINAGNNALAIDADGNPLTFDQRGEAFDRIVGSHVDVGAFEADERPGLFVTTNLDVVDSRDGLTSLREAILFADSLPGEDTITFDPSLSGSTIRLIEGSLELSSSITIQGLGADELTVSGDNQFRVFTEVSTNPIAVTITDLTIADGFTPPGLGASAFLGNRSNATFRRVVMTGNASRGNGSTLHIREGTLEIQDSAIVDNLGAAAGAIRLLDSDTTIVNTTISGNATGGIVVFNFGSDEDRLSLRNVTIANNLFGGVEAVASGSSTTFLEYQNTLFANNGSRGSIKAQGSEIGLQGLSIVSRGHNLLDDTPTGDAAHDAASGDLRNTDAMLAPLADNGGPTPTHALLSDSPAIDAGNNALAVDADSNSLVFDQRGEGFSRLVGSTVDIGAFEADELRSFVVTTDLDTVDSRDGLTSLREAIDFANSFVGEDTITFDEILAGSTITLTQGELELRSSLAIEGLGADELTISGGGASRVFAELGNGQRTITMSDLTIADGKATAGSGGGGAFFSNGGDITFQRVVMTNNDTTGGNGSAIVMAFGTLEIIDSAVVNNRGTGVGTLRLQDNTTTITNTTISGNATRGISLFNPSANPDRLSLANVTIADNSNEGIEVVAFASTTMLEYQNTLLANNGGQGSIDARGNENGLPGLAIVSLGHNLLDDTPAGDAAHDAAVGDLRDTDAMLAPLADNGGPTPTHALLEGSPAINAGNNALAIDVDGNPLTFDQRGEAFVRFLDGTVDIGAFESDVDIAIPTVESIVINDGDAQRSMVDAIAVNFSEEVNVSASDFILQNTDTGVNVTPDVSTQVIDGKTVATLAFSGDGIFGGSLADGNYRLTVLDSITDSSGKVLDGDRNGEVGGNATDEFFRLFGDINGDRTVNIIDFFHFRNAFGNGESDERFDFNGDGVINILDFFQFRSRVGLSI